MNILTKILIVLLAFASFFLCASIVVYVANAENYKEKYDKVRVELDSAKKQKENAVENLNKNVAKIQLAEQRLNSQITSLKSELTELKDQQRNTERENTQLNEKVGNMVSTAESLTQTNEKQRQLLENTLNELNAIQGKQIKQKKELEEITSVLMQKMKIIETLEIKNKRLLEEHTDLQVQLDKYLLPFGDEAASSEPVTPEKTYVKKTPTFGGVTKEISLRGLVTRVDLEKSMASISLGKADGVKNGMRFHVVRGDQFVCDILVIEVGQKEAVGILEYVQESPRAGDSATTNL